MKMSPAGLQLLTLWEGSKRKVYTDSAGLLTIGVGHLLLKHEIVADAIKIGGKPVRLRYGLSDMQIGELLAQDLVRFEDAINKNVSVTLSQNQFDALVSFSFNVGVTAFLRSSLLKEINSGNMEAVPNQMRRWNTVGGKPVQGLTNRREKEIRLWLGQTQARESASPTSDGWQTQPASVSSSVTDR